MTATTTTPKTRTFVLMGASGDLAERLLIPGLATVLMTEDRGAPQTHLVGCGRSELSHEDWVARVKEAFATVDASGERVEHTLRTTRYQQGDTTHPDFLRDVLRDAEGDPVLYFALPPAVVADMLDSLGQIERPEGMTLAFEKPFGTDAASARSLTAAAEDLVPDEHIHRTDHFLGEPVVLTLLQLRRHGRLLDRLLTREFVEHVEIVWDETLALEGRAGYYDDAGALVDMIQSHLLQVLAALALEPQPASEWTADTLHDAMAEVLDHTSLADGPLEETTLRARYTTGAVEGKTVPSYVDEDGVDPAKQTETLAELTMSVDTPRWAGVPFSLRSGKALAQDRKQVIVHLRDGARLCLRFAPQSVALHLDASSGDDASPLAVPDLDLTADLPDAGLTPYGQVVADLLENRRLLSVRGDIAVRCWEIVQPVIDAWQGDAVPMQDYAAGSEGPTSS